MATIATGLTAFAPPVGLSLQPPTGPGPAQTPNNRTRNEENPIVNGVGNDVAILQLTSNALSTEKDRAQALEEAREEQRERNAQADHEATTRRVQEEARSEQRQQLGNTLGFNEAEESDAGSQGEGPTVVQGQASASQAADVEAGASSGFNAVAAQPEPGTFQQAPELPDKDRELVGSAIDVQG